jgi:tetratricopeptide (TPR) repeat protein
VAFAHERLLLHRDLKPSNVLVDADGSVKLLDFGVSTLAGDPDAARAYSPGWSSPEQRAGESVGPASDQYQLGLLLDALLRMDPFAGDGPRRVEPAQWSLPAGLRRDELEAIARRATLDDPAQRYGSVREFADEIQRWLDRRPVRAHGAGLGYTLRRTVSRHPWATAASVAVALLVVGLVAGFSWRLAQERDRAQDEAQRAERAAAISNAVVDFVDRDILAAANPVARPPGAPEVTVRQALAGAVGAAAQRLAGEPEVAIAVLARIAELNHEFIEYDTALSAIERGLEIARAADLPEAATHALRAERAAIRISQSAWDAATEELEALESSAAAAWGGGDVRTLKAGLRLLEARAQSGRVDVGDELAAFADRADAALGVPNPVAAEARFRIGEIARMAGTPDRAAVALERAWAESKATLGDDHPTTLKASVGLALAWRASGRVDEALSTLRDAHALQAARYGENHPDAMWMLNELAFALLSSNRLEAAEPLFVRLVALREPWAVEQPMALVAPLTNLANTRLRLGRPPAALDTARAALRAVERVENAPPTVVAGVGRTLVDALVANGLLDEAGRELDRLRPVGESLPATDLRRLALRGSRAQWLLARGDRAEGLALLDDTIAAFREQVADDHPNLAPLIAARASATR